MFCYFSILTDYAVFVFRREYESTFLAFTKQLDLVRRRMGPSRFPVPQLGNHALRPVIVVGPDLALDDLPQAEPKLWLELHDRFDFHSHVERQSRRPDRRSRVISDLAVLKNFVDQVGRTAITKCWCLKSSEL